MSSIFQDAAAVSGGLLVGRVVFGALMAAHGSQKLFSWFGGHGLAGTGGYFESLGFRPGRLFALLAGLAEFTGGVLVLLGLFGPVGPALMLSVMVVAVITVHWKNGIFAGQNGIEVPLLYSAAAVALAFTGYGAYSLDSAFGLQAYWTQALTVLVLIAGVLGGVGNVMTRRTAAA